MKAVIFRRHGGPDVLEYADVPDPPLEDGQGVLVRVKACSINHLDIWIRQGIPAYRISLPHISGCDVAGVIERVGSGVSGVKAGDPVVLAPGTSCGRCPWCRAGDESLCASYGIRGAAGDGGYAELTAAGVDEVIPLPPGLSFEEAAAFPLVFLTAWHMLVSRAKLQAGETALVHAAGSGVGHAAVQIAKHLKATVLATVGSDAKVAKAKALGADEVINYRRERFEERVKALTGGRGVDVVVEHIGPTTWDGSLRVLAKGGRLVTCGSTSGPAVGLDLRYVFSRQLSVLGSMMGTRSELGTVVQLVGERKLRPVVDTVFPLREARAAQERMMNRDVFGKLVLAP
ncbi:MAG: zinc-binding dehydrogenase [Candidatus Omnitrophica bacterium]|nr:zinc-binding dehydrogenase [Candidatus Omnitrophota bacterium]MBI3011763.1 zinc-binding dehydrogenase [Candidatus Omnitrophota bacterium]